MMVLTESPPAPVLMSAGFPQERGSITLRHSCYCWQSGDRLSVVTTNRILETVMAVAVGDCVFVGQVFPEGCSCFKIKMPARTLILRADDVRLYEIQ